MELSFTVGGRIAKPIHEVYEAVADPAKLSEYFTTGGARGRLDPGATVSWDFHDFPGAFPVQVEAAEQDRRIELSWPGDASTGSPTRVIFDFEAIAPDRTLLRITESGWPDTAEGRRSSYQNCEGWTGMLCAMKAWLEHGVKLRQGFYK
ncbi:SRPBCC family protein [Paracoccus aminophilus]|uniref:Activator of Hsp90, ATPase 1 family protein n=1 Tax=Paracoccus aminophilus JCM 7686 TaxID=1367847 RepID=S5XV87_PARAH|nr:SRPBCC family protein [Paracoccus aminophilus]AGT07265.1 activator of Hsp90, ATPase 1 family protein [Paracoccus aminophilus JCM 7686]